MAKAPIATPLPEAAFSVCSGRAPDSEPEVMEGVSLAMLPVMEESMEPVLMGMLPLEVGISVRETPAAAQREETAGARPRVGLLDYDGVGNWWGVSNVLEISLCSQRSGAQVRSSFSIALFPLVHWHLVSVTPQLDLGRAATKQGIYNTICVNQLTLNARPVMGVMLSRHARACQEAIACPTSHETRDVGRRTAHWGIPDRSWAPTKATEATTARTVAWKRMLIVVDCCCCCIKTVVLLCVLRKMDSGWEYI